MAIAYRIAAIFALFQASVRQTWKASHARREGACLALHDRFMLA